MTLRELLKESHSFARVEPMGSNVGSSHAKVPSSSDPEVSSLCFDSRKLEKNCVFFAIRGTKSDGHDYLEQAAQAGAIALIVEDKDKVPANYTGTTIITKSTRVALNKFAAMFYHEPAKKLFCIGVTGTNGKTTTTYMTEAIFNHAKHYCGVVGTINHHFRAQIWPTEMTTPDPVQFQSRLADFVQLGARAVALEVSSHALTQARVDEVPFDVAVFTNLTRDHLDYHKDMDDYFEAKHKLFKELLSSSMKSQLTAVINDDDEYARRIQTAPNVKRWTYGPGAKATLRFEVQRQGFDGTDFKLTTPQGTRDFHLNMVGLHNILNACGAVGAALAAGISLDTAAEALAKLKGVTGRLEAVPNSKGIHVFVDYAHTDDALKTVLHYLNEVRTSSGLTNKLITVFGCGGDRDKGKRPLMAKAALHGSDQVVLTSDNPRTENPEAILDDAQAGIPQAKPGLNLFREVDRRTGIAKALSLAKKGDVVLIAGKGHEDYQIIGTQKFPFSDVEVVQSILESK